MEYHNWGDQNVDWKGTNDAAHYIGSYCRKWGRLGGDAKEKYGTVRFYASFGCSSLHSLVYPGYHFSRFPKWLWKLDIYYIEPALEKVIGKALHKWQQLIYSRAYHNALKKWPHLAGEILSASAYPEYIKDCTRYSQTVLDGKTEYRKHIINPYTGEYLSSWISSQPFN